MTQIITHLEPDILECEVKWALESITMNKASGSDEFQKQNTGQKKKIVHKYITV